MKAFITISDVVAYLMAGILTALLLTGSVSIDGKTVYTGWLAETTNDR